VSPPVSSLPDLFQISISSIDVTVIETNFNLHGNIQFWYCKCQYTRRFMKARCDILQNTVYHKHLLSDVEITDKTLSKLIISHQN